MKLSALLLSINIVAAMPQLAQAGEQTVSDKADWLRRNLKAMETIGSASTCKLSMSIPSVPKKTKTVKLRSFVPNRPLVRQKDLETYLVAQQARLDSCPPAKTAYAPYTGQLNNSSVLSGLVSTYSFASEPRLPQSEPAHKMCQAKFVKSQFPAQQPTLPGQVSAMSSLHAPIPAIPEPPRTTVSKTVPNTATSSIEPTSRPVEQVLSQAGALLVQAPVLSPDEQLLLDELVKLNRPGKFTQYQDISGTQEQVELPMTSMTEAQPHHDPGPPPFPLSLLPEDAIKDLMHRGPNKHINAPPAYFGSWHSKVSLSSLPKARFNSHIGLKQSPTNNQYAPIKYQVSQHLRQDKRSGLSVASISQTRARSAYQAAVLVYPSYDKNYRLSMF
ncbi:MAG: hypothetical protein HY711_10920 [Candidatus Melainabacteria bacterium]|nr:hypothetical protein [Candidatus Melainabacteria bacterium]